MLPTSILVPMQGSLQKMLTWVGAWNIVRAFSANVGSTKQCAHNAFYSN